MKKILLSTVMSLSFLGTANAAPIDLSSWSAESFSYSNGSSSSDWVLEQGNTAVIQTKNANPSFYMNNINQTSYSMKGSWQVLTSSDDDFMGFVFGYQNSSNFYLFDWKQSYQRIGHAIGTEGMTVKKYTGSTGNGNADLDQYEMWHNTSDYGDMTVLASNHGSDKGWEDGILYDFELDFNKKPGEIHIAVLKGAETLWDVTINDSTFSGGEFGFYNFSQSKVRYAGFEQEGGIPVPEPASILLMALSMLGLGIARRKQAAIG